MTYKTYLKNKNLSKVTIKCYESHVNKWLEYLGEKKINKSNFIKYINWYSTTHKPNSVRLVYSSILSFFKFQKKWKLYHECRDIKLPSQYFSNKIVISLAEYEKIKLNYQKKNWYDQRNWLIFLILFTTGIRVNELNDFKIRNIENDSLYLKCKGNKFRTIYINNFLKQELLLWKKNFVNVSKNNVRISNKQIIIIIKKIGLRYLEKEITPHSLRRSYATNLLRSKVDLKIVSNLLGHANINTTARYIHLTNEEMFNEIKNIF